MSEDWRGDDADRELDDFDDDAEFGVTELGALLLCVGFLKEISERLGRIETGLVGRERD